MIKEAIEKIIALSPVEVRELIPGMRYSDRPIHSVRPHEPFMQKNFKVCTLTGITEWLLSDDGKEARENCIVHIVDFDEIRVFSSPDDYYRNRHQYITSECKTNNFAFGQWHSIEAFIIDASSKFVMTDALRDLIKVVSNIKSTEVTTVEDDGISQRVQASNELHRVSEVKITPFQMLRPYRTFREIEQPESRFLLRIKQRKDELPTVALFEADNGEWKLEAMRSIADFIAANLTDNCEGINIVM